eukprot:1124065-Prorocentrum_minimum.AAC.1
MIGGASNGPDLKTLLSHLIALERVRFSRPYFTDGIYVPTTSPARLARLSLSRGPSRVPTA